MSHLDSLTHVVRAADRRRSETPNAVMLTAASPSLSGAQHLSLWSVEMASGADGPVHVFGSEQLWSVVTGRAEVRVDGTTFTFGPGDTVTVPGGAVRQFTAVSDLRVVVAGYADIEVRVVGEDQPRGTPPWIS